MSDMIQMIEHDNGVAQLFLNRPEVGNAFNDGMIAALQTQFEALANNTNINILIITGVGKHFCLGADLNWMAKMIDYSESENFEDAKQLSNMLDSLYHLPQVTIALINGHAYGGGLGLIACCDFALAVEHANFCFSEVKLGLTPSVISPYVVRAIGVRRTQQLFLNGQVFDALAAERFHLLSSVHAVDVIEAQVERLVSQLTQQAPHALRHCKQLINTVKEAPITAELQNQLAQMIAALRVSPEGQEGTRAFLEKRKPIWLEDKA